MSRGVSLVLLCLCALTQPLRAERNYLLEFGPKAGASLLAQDPVSKNMSPRLTYGADLRYKFSPRWAVGVSGTHTTLHFTDNNDDTFDNNLLMFDAKGEFNFFRLSHGWTGRYSRSWSPYIMAGLGFSVQTEGNALQGYLPFGIGIKWKMAERWNLTAAWQANWYFSDGIEGTESLNDPYGVNSNMLDHDLLQTLMVTITFNFWRAPGKCYRCGN